MASGVTAATWRSMIMDSAVAYVDYGLPTERIMGATNGGVTFGFETFNVRSPEIDGVKGRLAGVSRITEASPQITVNLVDFQREVLPLMFPGSDVVEQAGKLIVTRNARVIPLEDYPENLAMVGTQSGTGQPVVMMIKRPMCITGAEIPTADDTEATSALTFVGHYDPADIEQEPWEIQFPIATTGGELLKLSVSPASVSASASVGDVVGAISRRAPGSTIVSSDPRFVVDGNNLEVGAVLTAGTIQIALTEILDGAAGSPRASLITIVVEA